jgi:Putative beta-lactamase-inhibitor-like, PepSY-like
MKTLLSLMVILWLASCTSAQSVKEDKVPVAVVSAFHKLYSAVKNYSWEMEDGNYEAEMDHGKMKASAVFDAAGNLMMTEKDMAVSELPPGCADYVSKNYPGIAIKEAAEITSAKGVKTYEAEVKGVDLIFDANGNYAGQENDDEQEEDDE